MYFTAVKATVFSFAVNLTVSFVIGDGLTFGVQ